MKTIGGQAVIEGVLMRDKESYSIAIRKDNKIKTIKKKIKQPNKFWRIPFFRGIYSLFETLLIGIKALNYSAKQQEEKEEELKTLFQYHGAEHKTVNCYEADKELTISNVKKYSTLHVRCGTSFIMIVILISIFVYSFIPNIAFLWKYFYRILLLPVIAGISYEILKLEGKYKENKFWQLISKPGLFIQKLTTAEL